MKRVSVLLAISLVMFYLPACSIMISSTQEVIPAPTEAVPIETTPLQTPENPVKIYYNDLNDVYLNTKASLDKYAQKDIQYLDDIMSFIVAIQRAQSFFSGCASLVYSSDNYWDGYLFGAESGSGSVSGTENDASFKCTFYGSKQITGSIKNGSLSAEWQALNTDIVQDNDEETTSVVESYDTFRTIHITKTDNQWFIELKWDDGYNYYILLSSDELYFALKPNDGGLDKTLSPEQWADWYYINDTFTLKLEDG